MSKIERRHQSGIKFDWVLVREIRLVDPSSSGARIDLRDLSLELSLQTSIAEDQSWCAVRIGVQLTPPQDLDDAFSALSATIEGRFSHGGDETSVSLAQFAKVQAPAILMPFLREEIATATAKTRFGAVLLPPINVVALTQETEQEELELSRGSAPE